MNKLISRIAVLGASIGMAVAVGVAVSHRSSEVARAAEGSVTINNASSNTDGTVTVTIAKASGSSAPITGDYGVRLYANNTVTITCDANITSLTIPWTKNPKKDFATVTASVGEYTHPTAAGDGTWSGEAKSIVLTVGSSGQIQFNAVNYETGSSKVLQSIALTADDAKVQKNYYDGQTPSNAGLTVMATYDSGDPVDVTSKATITPTPAKVALSTTSISYTATFGGKTSNAVEVTGITVEEAPPATDVDITIDSAESVTTEGITVAFAQAAGQNAPIYGEDYGVRLYAKNTITVSSEEAFSSITFNWTKNSSKAFATVTANTGSYTHPTAPGQGVWTGSATNVVFTLGDSGQIQCKTMVVGFGEAPTPKTVTSVDSVATHPSTVALNSSIAASSVTLNVTYSDDSHDTVPATSVTCDTSSLGQKTATAYYNSVGSATFQVEVVKVNPIQALYSLAKDAPVDVNGIYVGFLDGTGPVIMDGEYGVVIYNKTADVSSYTVGETKLHVTGKISIYSGLYEIVDSSIELAPSASVDAPVTYSVVGGETAEYASRVTTVSGKVTAPSGAFDVAAGTSDITLTFTVGTQAVTVFYKKAAQTADAEAYNAVKKAVTDETEITVKGFTAWHDGFQVQMTGYIKESEDYTAEQFSTELLAATNAKCATYVDGSSSFEEFKTFFQGVWNEYSSKYATLPADEKEILTNSQASETGDTIQKAMARYDFLTGKYGLSEFINGRVIDYSIYAGMPEISRGGVAGYVIVISIGTASILAIGLVLMLKKKKHTK